VCGFYTIAVQDVRTPMEPARALEVDSDLDLKVFSAYLWQRGIVHRVFEERGRQVLEVADAAHVGVVRSAFEAWRAGALTLRTVPSSEPRGSGAELANFTTFGDALRRYPALIGLAALAVLCYPATAVLERGQVSAILNGMMIVDVLAQAPARPVDLALVVEIIRRQSSVELLLGVLRDGEIWRFVTPALLHFTITHLAFNLVAIAIFGRPIERGAGSLALVWIVLATAAVGNVAQFLVSGSPLFGGLSGVAYGLFGFVAVRSRQAPGHPIWALNPAFTLVIVAMLLLMTTGITEVFDVHIAHAAHWAGLGSGALLALARPLKHDVDRDNDTNDRGEP
jgi:GlpG protein